MKQWPKEEHVDSYDPKAVIPIPGSLWLWETHSPYARSLLFVDTVLWNGEEWFVETKTLNINAGGFSIFDYQEIPYFQRDRNTINDISRFFEACIVIDNDGFDNSTFKVDHMEEGKAVIFELTFDIMFI